MAYLIKIGNSQGIRIPKPFIKQAHLENKELILQVVDEGLLVIPKERPRVGWQEAIEAVISVQGAEEVDAEWLDTTLQDEAWEW